MRAPAGPPCSRRRCGWWGWRCTATTSPSGREQRSRYTSSTPPTAPWLRPSWLVTSPPAPPPPPCGTTTSICVSERGWRLLIISARSKPRWACPIPTGRPRPSTSPARSAPAPVAPPPRWPPTSPSAPPGVSSSHGTFPGKSRGSTRAPAGWWRAYRRGGARPPCPASPPSPSPPTAAASQPQSRRSPSPPPPGPGPRLFTSMWSRRIRCRRTISGRRTGCRHVPRGMGRRPGCWRWRPGRRRLHRRGHRSWRRRPSSPPRSKVSKFATPSPPRPTPRPPPTIPAGGATTTIPAGRPRWRACWALSCPTCTSSPRAPPTPKIPRGRSRPARGATRGLCNGCGCGSLRECRRGRSMPQPATRSSRFRTI
mmetsp:Transcript_1363/g.4347  ORF Transcript_1363/g.4347 Transcript_1363/m.4347 type:complete len:368 (-) Transcript_1363:2336-3439(-)